MEIAERSREIPDNVQNGLYNVCIMLFYGWDRSAKFSQNRVGYI